MLIISVALSSDQHSERCGFIVVSVYLNLEPKQRNRTVFFSSQPQAYMIHV